jgi:dephospho-CoA kinase
MPATEKKPFVLGITGSIASGKSIVGKILSEMGIPVIDSDELVHQLLKHDRGTKKAIVENFGTDILSKETLEDQGQDQSSNGEPWDNRGIDRKKLGQVVFASEQERRKLEKIVHPNTILALRRSISALKDKPLVAVLVPLLFESGLQSEYDQIWTVFTDDNTLRQRLKERDHLSEAEIDSRLRAQMPQEEKIKLANQVIDNSSSPSETERQVRLLVQKILPTGSKI